MRWWSSADLARHEESQSAAPNARTEPPEWERRLRDWLQQVDTTSDRYSVDAVLSLAENDVRSLLAALLVDRRAIVALADELDRNALAVPPSIEAIVAEARTAVPTHRAGHE